MKDTTPGFDLDSVESVTSAEINLVHPITGQPTGAKLQLASPEHPARRRIAMEQSRRLRAQMQAMGDQELSDDQVQEMDTEMLVASTLGWSHLRERGGVLTHTPDECRRVYTDPRYAWVRQQVQTALGNRATFTQASAAA